MSRSVTFNGITQFKPGGLTKIDANALAQIGLATNGVVGLIGEANGGDSAPAVLVTIDDPAQAVQAFESGPLADAVRIAFEPASDPRIPGGAFRVQAIVVNNNTQSTLILSARIAPVIGALSTGPANGTTGIDTAAAASTQTVINLTTGALVANAEVGNHVRIGQEVREIIANTTTAVSVATAFSSAPAIGDPVNILATHRWVAAPIVGTVITLAGGSALVVDALIGNTLRLGNEVRTITDNDATTITVAPAFTATPVVGQIVEVLAPSWVYTSAIYGKKANRIQQEYESGAISGSAWTAALDDASQVSDDIGARSWLDVEFVGEALRTLQASGVTDGAGSNVQLADSLAAFPLPNGLAGYAVYADDAGTLDVDNIRIIASNLAVSLTVTAPFTNLADAATIPGALTNYEIRTGQIHTGTLAAGSSFGCTLEATIDFALNELQGMVIAIVSGTGSGQRRVVRTNTAGNSSVLVVDKGWTTNPDNTSVYEFHYATAANATISGAQGVATAFSTRKAVNGVVEGADLNIAFTTSMTIQDLVNSINQNTDYLAAIPGNISPLAFVNDFDHDSGSYRVNIQNDKAADSAALFPQINPPAPWPNHFRKDAAEVVSDITATSAYATVARSTGTATQQGAGAGRPEFTGGALGTVGDAFLYMSGATRGTSTNLRWQNAFDELLKTRVNHLVPLISEDLSNQTYGSTATFATVAAQLKSHVGEARGVEKTERGSYMGMKGTRAQLLAQAATFGDIDVALTGQQLTTLDAAGSTLVEQDEWSSAVAAAGMRAGMPEVGEPLTWKYLKTNALAQDASWDPLDRADANAFIKGGILFAEFIEGTGYRWVRDLTTWTRDDNLAFSEGSVRDEVRFISYGLRTFLENRYTGVKAGSSQAASSTQPKPTANAASIKDSVAEYLEGLRSENIIVDSTDASGNLVNAYNKIRVNISGDIARIRVECFPGVGINFQLTEIFLQLPTQSA